MRWLMKIVIGMILFNAFLLLFSPYFVQSGGTVHDAASDVADEHEEQYGTGRGIEDMLKHWIINARTLGLFLVLLGVGALGGVLTGRNVPLCLGIALVVATISTLYLATIDVFVSLVSQDPMASGFFTIMTFIIGVLVIFSLGDWLSGRQEASG